MPDPGMRNAAPGTNQNGIHYENSGHQTTHKHHFSLPDPDAMLQGVHVVMVAYKVASEVRYRRRFYLNLGAAQKAVDRAVMRGQSASIILCRLAPAGPATWQSGGPL